MSIPYSNAAWEVEGLTVAEKLVLVCLADFANAHGTCWPSMDTLSKRICGSERHVRTQIRKLEERGILSTKRRGKRSLVFTLKLTISDRNNSSTQGSFKRNNSSGHKRNHSSGQSPLSGTIVPAEPSFKNHQENQTPLTPRKRGERKGKPSASSRADNFSESSYDDSNTFKPQPQIERLLA